MCKNMDYRHMLTVLPPTVGIGGLKFTAEAVFSTVQVGCSFRAQPMLSELCNTRHGSIRTSQYKCQSCQPATLQLVDDYMHFSLFINMNITQQYMMWSYKKTSVERTSFWLRLQLSDFLFLGTRDLHGPTFSACPSTGFAWPVAIPEKLSPIRPGPC